MQVTKGTWRMREQCVPGSLSSSHARQPGNEVIQGVKVLGGVGRHLLERRHINTKLTVLASHHLPQQKMTLYMLQNDKSM